MSAEGKKRIWEIDAVRGFLILCVIVAHSLFFGAEVLGLFTLSPLVSFVIGYGGALFVLLSGLSSTLGTRSFDRGLVVFTGGMILTVGSIVAVKLGILGEDMIIRYGVLHLLGTAMLLTPLLRRLPTWELAIFGLVVVVYGYILEAGPAVTESRLLFPLGLRYPGFSSGDYFPLAPHLGGYCLGMSLGRLLYREKRTLLPRVYQGAPLIRFFTFCGRNSLYIFILHLPVVGGVMMLLAMLLKK
jgi:uncharacterized membrane protein